MLPGFRKMMSNTLIIQNLKKKETSTFDLYSFYLYNFVGFVSGKDQFVTGEVWGWRLGTQKDAFVIGQTCVKIRWFY